MIQLNHRIKIFITILVSILLIINILMVFAWSGILSHRLDNDDLAYRILQITDIHLLNNDKDKKAFETVDMLIKESNPDLIVVTGDISSESENQIGFTKFGKFIEQYKIPWTFTFGNHDTEGKWKKPDVSEYFSTLTYCTYEDGYISPALDDKRQPSHGNYYQNIVNDKDEVIMSLIFMDSNMQEYNSIEEKWGYENFHEDQIVWYENTIKQIAIDINDDENKVLPSLAFFHIPMQEYKTGYKAKDVEKLYGYKLEDVFCPVYDDQMFETMIKLKSTKATFVGHDHMNNYCIVNQGIRLTYGYSCDHNIYFVPKIGGTIINIKNNGTFTQQGIYRNRGIGKIVIAKAV